MPLYDYENTEDGTRVEVAMSIHEDHPDTMEMGGVVYRRIFAPIIAIYNAFGFNKTDSLDSIERWRKENL